jgi:lysophospholipase
MDLFATPGNPIPADPILSAVRTDDGLTLRVVRWSAPRDGRGTVVVAIGRSEFIEEYFEIVQDLRRRHFGVVLMDWRGQGQSEREIGRRRRGHVRHFDVYQRDLAALEVQILQPFVEKPWFGLGHSMGAAILLDQAHAGRSPYERLVFSAPMIDLPLRFQGAIAWLARIAVLFGFGERLVPGGSEESIFKRGFEGNLLTSDRARYDRTSITIAMSRDLAVGAPTIGWLRAAFRLMRKFRDPRFAMETQVPILIVAAGADRIVDTLATERFAARLKAGRCITIPDARHEIMMERDALRDQFWAAFDAFVPGTDDAMARRAREAMAVP